MNIVEQKVIVQAMQVGASTSDVISSTSTLGAYLANGYIIKQVVQSVVPDAYREGYAGSQNSVLYMTFVVEKTVGTGSREAQSY